MVIEVIRNHQDTVPDETNRTLFDGNLKFLAPSPYCSSNRSISPSGRTVWNEVRSEQKRQQRDKGKTVNNHKLHVSIITVVALLHMPVNNM